MRFTEEQLLFFDKVLDYSYKSKGEGKPLAFEMLHGDLFQMIEDNEQQELLNYFEDNDIMNVVTQDYDTDHWVITSYGREIFRDYGSFSNLVIAEQEAEKIERRKDRRSNHLINLQIFKHWLAIIAFIASIGFNVYFYTDLTKLKEFIKIEEQNAQTTTDTIPLKTAIIQIPKTK